MTVFLLQLPLGTYRHADMPHSDYQWELCLKLSFKQESQDPTYPSIKIHLFLQFLNRRKKSSSIVSIINKYSKVIYLRDIFFSFLLESTLRESTSVHQTASQVSLMQPPQEPRLLGFVSKRREGKLHFYEVSRGISLEIV